MSAIAFPETISRKIGDFVFQIPTTIKPGDPLSYNDAVLFNISRGQNIAQTLLDRVKKFAEEGKSFEEINSEVQRFALSYSYSPNLSFLPPIEREMIAIAEAELVVIVRRKGSSFEDLPRARREELRNSYLAAHGARLRSEADRRLAELDSLPEIDLGDLS